MKNRTYDKEGFSTSKWSGGETSQFAIFPETSKYIDRDFIWRLSSAAVELDESTFTKLPDYDRVLMVLEGEAVLAHGTTRTVKLSAGQQDSFGGEEGTKCFGKIKDYNLMFKKGCSGRLEQIEVQSAAQSVAKGERGEHTHASYGFYCLSGYTVVSVGGQAHMVSDGTQLVLDMDEGEDPELTIMGEGTVIMAEVFYNRYAHAAVEIPEEKATFEDFKAAFKLARGRNKWKKATEKKRDVWYDEALQAKLAFLDKTFIGIILWLVVSFVIVMLAVRGFSHTYAIILIIAWTVLYGLVISPLIYMIVLPKPIKAHIKSVDSLTEYEKMLYDKEQDKNEMTDKLLKKYKYSGGTGWDVEEESIFSKFKK